MKLVVGLGNPGKEYTLTRHNIGFMVVEEIARRQDAGAQENRGRDDHVGKVVNDVVEHLTVHPGDELFDLRRPRQGPVNRIDEEGSRQP